MISRSRQILRNVAPSFVRRWWLDRKREKLFGPGDADARSVFETVYRERLWGGDGQDPYSGPGSDDAATADFVRVVRETMAAHGLKSVVDIGCGDFRVGRQIANPDIAYTGVDVVRPLIERNTKEFGSPRIRFLCADAVTDALPEADLCITREVLQHLSNAKIEAVLQKMTRYPFALICEAQPAPARLKRANMDKPTGHDTRLFFDSGIYPDKPPFSMANGTVVSRTKLNEFLVSPDEEFVTYLFQNPHTARR